MKRLICFIIVILFIFFLRDNMYAQTPTIQVHSSTPVDGGTRMLPLIPKDPKVIYTEFTDYVLKIKVITDVKCDCDLLMYRVDSAEGKIIFVPAKFLEIQIEERVLDFSMDHIGYDSIKPIKYLMVPRNFEIPYDTSILVLVHRAYTYDYLEINRIVNPENKFFRRSLQYAGNSGLYKNVKDMSKIGEFLFCHHLITFERATTGKSKIQKNIELCIRQLKHKQKR